MRYLHNRIIAAISLFVFAALLASCLVPAASSTGGSPPAGATATANQASPTPLPSTGSQQPTPLPSSGNQQPTSAPAVEPTIDFQPRGGAAGTTVGVRGWGFAANRRVALRIGLPQAVGEV